MNVSTNYKILSMNHSQMGKTLLLLAVMQRWEIYVLYIFGEYFQWSSRYSLLLQPQPDERTLLLLAVVCHDEIYYKYMDRIYIDEYTVLQWTMISSLVMQLMVITRFENVFLLGCSLQQWEINLYARIKLAPIYRWYFSGL